MLKNTTKKLDSQEEYEQREPYVVTCDQCETKYKTKIEPNWVCCGCKLNYTNFYCPACEMLEEYIYVKIFEMEQKDPILKETHKDREKYRILFKELMEKERTKRIAYFKDHPFE